MSYDLGPFQNLVGISFPGYCAPGNLHPYFAASSESIMLRKGEDYYTGANWTRLPGSGYQWWGGGPGGCNFAGFQLSVYVPNTLEWPDCGYGLTSGAGIRKSYWPDAPEDVEGASCPNDTIGICVWSIDQGWRWRVNIQYRWLCGCPCEPFDPWSHLGCCGDPAAAPPID